MENQLLSGYCCMVKIQVPVAFHLGRKKKKKKNSLWEVPWRREAGRLSFPEQPGQTHLLGTAGRRLPEAADDQQRAHPKMRLTDSRQQGPVRRGQFCLLCRLPHMDLFVNDITMSSMWTPNFHNLYIASQYSDFLDEANKSKTRKN